MPAPSVLLLSNHPTAEGNPGQIDALEILVATGELASVEVVHAGSHEGESSGDRSHRVCLAIAESTCDVLLVLSIKDRVRDVDGIRKAVAGRPILFWEGDAWGSGKKIPTEMAAWLEMSDHVFSVGGQPQVQLLQANGATRVHHTVHTYDHVLFRRSENGEWVSPDLDIAFIGSNLSAVPLVSGLPGSAGRWRLVSSLKRRNRKGFVVGGRGWPRGVSVGQVPFAEQDRFIQRARLVANWDHFPATEAYTSDRMAIAMIAARAQVSTLHPNMEWLPGHDYGLFLEPTVTDVIRRTSELLQRPPGQLTELGRAAHTWARRRLSHREAIRHMLSTVFPEIEPPPTDPWDRLPGPWGGTKLVDDPSVTQSGSRHLNPGI